MRIAVSATDGHLQAEASPTFGRCPQFVFLETETMGYEAVENPGAAARGGAGIQAAEFVVQHGAQAVLTGEVGPNAARVLEAAGVPVYRVAKGTVGEVAKAFRDGIPPPAPDPNERND